MSSVTGYLALAFGAAGVVLPVLPTTPFVILAAFAFGKSSPNMRAWLADHRLSGPAIRAWETSGAIPRRYKAIACAAMAATFAGSALFGAAPVILIVQAVFLTGAAAFVLTRPSPD